MHYARCAYCGYTAPLTCSGQFMPHPTALISMIGTDPTCPACGPLPPIFTCPFMHTQYLYVPGASPMPQPGTRYVYAPVVQAQPGILFCRHLVVRSEESAVLVMAHLPTVVRELLLQGCAVS